MIVRIIKNKSNEALVLQGSVAHEVYYANHHL